MNIVLLAAGTSSRMGKINKLLISVDGESMVKHAAMIALDFLETTKEKSKLIIVTGYQAKTVQKELKETVERIVKTDCPIELVIVKNKNYRKGQFSSVKTGVREVPDNEPFFISLSDMPFITTENYSAISKKIGKFAAVRPFVDGVPGHPVYLAKSMKQVILKAHCNTSVSALLKKYQVYNLNFSEDSWIRDIDTPEDVLSL